MKRNLENCMDFIEAVHRDRVYPLMYCHVELTGGLDTEKLKQAVSASSQFVPEILWVYDGYHNRFIDKGFTVKDVVQTTEPASPQWEINKAPQLQITVRQKQHTASVVFGMSHVLADGTGFLQYLYLLAALYNGEGPHVKNIREIAPVLGRACVGRRTMQSRHGKACAVQPLRSQSQGNGFFCLCATVSGEDWAALRVKAKSSYATLNDVFMSAYARVIARRQSIACVTLSCPADLRRFHPMPDAITIANMTGIYREVTVDIEPDDPFCRTLSQVNIEMNLQKSRRRCFSGIPLLNWSYPKFPRWFVAQAIKKTYHIMPVSYTNIGVIDDKKLLFNGCQITDCFVTGTYRLPPDFQLSISTFRDTCKLNCAFVGELFEEKPVQEILDQVRQELLNWTHEADHRCTDCM